MCDMCHQMRMTIGQQPAPSLSALCLMFIYNLMIMTGFLFNLSKSHCEKFCYSSELVQYSVIFQQASSLSWVTQLYILVMCQHTHDADADDIQSLLFVFIIYKTNYFIKKKSIISRAFRSL